MFSWSGTKQAFHGKDYEVSDILTALQMQLGKVSSKGVLINLAVTPQGWWKGVRGGSQVRQHFSHQLIELVRD